MNKTSNAACCKELARQLRSPQSEKDDVCVVLGRGKKVKQPGTFVLCPMGMQFHSPAAIKDYTLMEFKLAVKPKGKKKAENVTCTGAVVRCESEKKKGDYRVWIKFLDLAPEQSEKIRCVARDGKHLCCFCENF